MPPRFLQRYGFSGKGADAELLLQIAHLCFTFGASAEAVALIAAFRCHELNPVGICYLSAYLFQDLTGQLSSCHSQSIGNLNVIGSVNKDSTPFPLSIAELNFGSDLTTRNASVSRSGCTPFIILTFPIVPSTFT